MEKKIEDYLYLLIGQKFYRGGTPDEILNGLMIEPDEISLCYGDGDLHIFKKDQIITHKPILRPLSNMTREEVERAYSYGFNDHKDAYENEAERTAYLLKQGFDLFGLIEAGLAIYKTKI